MGRRVTAVGVPMARAGIAAAPVARGAAVPTTADRVRTGGRAKRDPTAIRVRSAASRYAAAHVRRR